MSLQGPWAGVMVAALATLGQALEAEVPAFDRYGVILERKPFGEETVPVAVTDPSKPILPPDQSFTAKFRMVAVTRNDRGVIQVGLVDLRNNRSFMLGIGDSLDGVEVVDADYGTERARLRRLPEDYWVSMLGGSNQYEFVREKAPVPAPAAAGAPAPARKAPERSSYAARKQSREEIRIRKELERLQAEEARRTRLSKTEKPATVASVRAAKPGSAQAPLGQTGRALLEKLGQAGDAEAEMTPEEINALLQEYQKELIRAGQPPLPIPLTPETDQQLVDEGVLPPLEP